VRLVQGHFKRGILMRQGQARMIAHQWTLAEQQALHERDSKATGEDSEPLLQKKEKGGDKKIKKVKSLAKDPVLLPPGEEDGAVPLYAAMALTPPASTLPALRQGWSWDTRACSRKALDAAATYFTC
jgi:hypothetical protein